MKIKTKEMGGVRQRGVEIRTANAFGKKIDRTERNEIENALKHQLSASDRRKWDRMPSYEKEKLIRNAIGTTGIQKESQNGATGAQKANHKGGGIPYGKASSSFLRYEKDRKEKAEEKFKEGVKGSSGSETKTSGYGASSPDGDRGTSGGGSGSSGAGGAEGVGTGPAAETTAKTAEHTKDAAATVASGGAYAPVKAVKTVKKALNAAKKVAESVKRKMEPKDYEAQNRRMGYGQPMEQNANGTSDRKTRKMADKVKPLIAVASISVMPIVAAMATTVSIIFLFLVPVLGFASTDTIYPPSEAMADEDYLLIKTEMEKYMGMPYVWAGDRPETSFDCSGLTAWVYGRALGISLPHSAQGQYDMSTPVAPENAKPGDLVFFYGTYETDKYITHVGIYAGEGIMYEAGGGGIKYTDFTTAYWVEHFVGFGRVVKEP